MTLKASERLSRQLQLFFPQQTQNSFVCQKPVKFSQSVSRCNMICEKRICRQECQNSLTKSFLLQAENCENEKIDIFSSIAWELQVKQRPNPIYGQTWIEDLISAADFFITPAGEFEIVLVSLPRTRVLVDENGEEHEIQSLDVVLSYKQTADSSGIMFDLELNPSERGLNQLLYFGLTDRQDYFIKRWGLLK